MNYNYVEGILSEILLDKSESGVYTVVVYVQVHDESNVKIYLSITLINIKINRCGKN